MSSYMADGVASQSQNFIRKMKMKMKSSLGVNLRVTGHCHQGSRKYMEDMFCVAYQQTEDGEDLEYAYFGIFDGHGGKEAAVFARERLMEFIVNEKKFWSDDDEDVLSAIKCGYLATHNAMWKELGSWPKTSSGRPSTSGTTATVAFIRNGKLYIGHVGDSSLVLGYQAKPGPPHEDTWLAKPLTEDHKPESEAEINRIERCGGKVRHKSGVPRVVWNRPQLGHKGPVRRSTPIDEIPFLAVARSLGDLWSYNSDSGQFIVSPEPDVKVLKIDTSVHRCLIFGTDGFWNMVSPTEAVHIAQEADRHNETQMSLAEDQQACENTWVNPSKRLVDRAIRYWNVQWLRADNTSVVTLLLNPPCSQGASQLSKAMVVSHNHRTFTIQGSPPAEISEPLEHLPVPPTQPQAIPVPVPVPVSGVDLVESNQNFLPLTNAIPHLSESNNEGESKLKNPLNNILPLLNTKHIFDFEDFRKEKPYQPSFNGGCTTRSSPQQAIQCNEIDSSISAEEDLRATKMTAKLCSRADDRRTRTHMVGEATPSPILNPIAASTPAYPPGICYSRSAALKEKVPEVLQRRGRMHPIKGTPNDAGPSGGNVLPLSANVESSSHLRRIKRPRMQNGVVWDQNASFDGKQMKKNTRSDDKAVLVSSARNGGDEKFNTEDAENERVAWPSNWINEVRPCTGDEGSEENNVLNCSGRKRKRCKRSSGGSPLSGLRQARARPSEHLCLDRGDNSRMLRSDTNAASHSRTLRSRNVDVRSPVKIPYLASKASASKRSVHLRTLASELNRFSQSTSLLQASKSPSSTSKRRVRSVVTRSRV